MNASHLSCVLIGESALLVTCAEILRQRGHFITGVISRDASLNKTPRFTSLRQARETLSKPPDVLFSIVNRYVLCPDDIAWPTLTAVNYHDSPLPRYAGVNAPSWAIMYGEPEHGVTWHRVTPEIDAGEIYVQRMFAMDAEETALSLNVKCYEHALASFELLLEKFERGDFHGVSQDISQRSVFGKTCRLPRNGILCWDHPTESLCRMVRACHHGPYANDFGLPKVVMPDGSLLIAGKARPTTVEWEKPGVVAHAARSSLTVTTLDGAVLLECLSGIDGRLQVLPDGLTGTTLPILSNDQFAEMERTDQKAAKDEFVWIGELLLMEPPLTVPWIKPEKHPELAGTEHVAEITLIDRWNASEILAWVVSVLANEIGRSRFTVGFVRSSPLGFAKMIPVSVHSLDGPAPKAFLTIKNAIEAAEVREVYPLDLFCRFPTLRSARLRLAQITVLLCSGNCLGMVNPGLVVCVGDGRLVLSFAADKVEKSVADQIVQTISLSLVDKYTVPRSLSMAERDCWAHVLVSAQAVKFPAKTAVEMGDESISYGELEARSNRLATLLHQQGAGPESRIAVLIPRSIDLIVSLLGIMKAGAAYVPLDILMPRERLSDIVQDATPLMLICTGLGRQVAFGLDVPFIDLDEQVAELASMPPAVPMIKITGDNLAYIIYTSGSSGRPKGSMIEHGAFSHFIAQDVIAHAISPSDRILQLCSTVFDASLEEIFSALITGATLVLLPVDLHLSARNVLDFCEYRRLTVIGIFAATLGDMLAEMERRGSFPSSVRLATTGGERVAVADVRRWQQFFLVSGCNAPRLINVYGLTETTVANLLCDLSSLSVDGDETPIGLPLLGNLVRIVDENLEPIYDGGVGELFLGGPQLARAYLNRPEINAERFISDSTDGTRWFRTGDAVRRLSTGNLVFLGRLDHQIKLNGFRIEPADIEAALCYHPFIDKACVTCREDIPGTRHLVAYWIPASDSLADIPATELRSFLTETLPEYMIPSMFIRLDVFPLTPNGKIDRNGLPAPLFHAKADDSSTCAPRTLLEHRLLEVWKDVLGRSDFGIHDNFFYLGGDSLTAANITSRIEEVIGQRLSTVALFHAQTIADLATHLQADTNTKPTWQSLIPLQPLGNASPIFVVHGWGGFVWHYLDLALALAPERPVFGLQAIGLDGSTPRHSSINQMAAHYADQIRTLQPKGPYHLLGYSGGGLYAYAVAAELLRHGGSIGMLCMFDSDAVLTYRRIAFLYMIIRLPVHVHKFFRSRPASLKSLIKGRILALQYHLKNLDHQQQGIDIQADQSMNQQGDYFLQLLETYRPPRLPIHIHIFSRPSGMLYKRLLWRFYARKGVVIYPMFNTHEDYYRADLIPELADRLRFVLHQIESRNSK